MNDAMLAPRPGPLRFVVLSITLLAVIAVVAAHAPARLKLIGLFPAAIGIASAAAVVMLGERHGVSSRMALLTAFFLVPVALSLYAGESYRAWRSARYGEVAANLIAQPGGRAILDEIRSGKAPANETEAEFFAAYRDRMAPPPSAYLTDRLRGLSVKATPPWATAIAAVEFAVGCLAGLGAAVFLVRRGRTVGPSEIRA